MTQMFYETCLDYAAKGLLSVDRPFFTFGSIVLWWLSAVECSFPNEEKAENSIPLDCGWFL